MDEATPTTPASEPASAPAGSEEGAGGGSQPDAGTLAPERDALDLRVRQEQSRADRAEARLRELEARLNAGTNDGGAPAAQTSEGLTLADLRAEMRRTAEITAALPTLRDEFPYADEAILARADEYDSAEALRAALENSHKSVENRIAPAVAEEVRKLKERYSARFGPLTDDIAPPGGEPATVVPGMPTLQELQAMPFAEYRKFADANPEYVNNLLRTA